MPPKFHWPVDLTLALRVTERPLTDYVSLACAPELVETMTNKICAAARSSRQAGTPRLRIAFAVRDVPVACEVFVRPSGEAEYTAMHTAFGFTRTLTGPPGRSSSFDFPLSLDKQTIEPRSIDIQLRLAPRMACCMGWNECFGGVIEWLDLPLRDNAHIYPMEHTSPPTHVYPCDEQ